MWNFATGDKIYSSPAIAQDGTIYIGSNNGKLYAIHPDGSEMWNFATGSAIYSSPAIALDGTIYFGSWDHYLYAVYPNGTEKWTVLTPAALLPSPAIASDGTIYIGDFSANLYALYPNNGTIKWTNTDAISPFYASPAIASDGTIYAGSWGAKIYAFYPNGTQKWNFTTGGSVESTPTIALDGTIYIGSNGNKFYALNPDGTEKWNFTASASVSSSPAIASDGTIYVGSSNWKLYAFEGSSPPLYTTRDYLDGNRALYFSLLGNQITEFSPNTAPVTSNLLTEAQTNPTQITDFTPDFSWTYFDDDSDPQVAWLIYVGTSSGASDMWSNGVVSGADTSDIYAGFALSRGVTYYVQVKTYDGPWESNWATGTFKINQLPAVSNVAITPIVSLTADNLTANNDTATDGDGDGVTLYYLWYKNDILQPDLNGATTVLSGNTSTGEVWKLGIIPNDGYENGTEVFSAEVTIFETLYPSDVNVSVGGTEIYTGTGNLITSVNMPDFSAEINSFLSSCPLDGEGYCNVPLAFEFTGPGKLYVDGLSVTYTDGGTKVQALVTSDGLEDTTLKNFWFTATTGDVCMLNSAEVPLEVGDMYFAENDSCAFTCDNFVAVRATTTCGSSAEFKGTPEGC